MINKVMRFVKEQHMFDAKDYVVAGVSGGADSVCLLFMLLEIQKVIPIALHLTPHRKALPAYLNPQA